MKTLLSIIAALALLVAFSMPAMADSATNNDDSAVAQNDSVALRANDINLSNIGNDNSKYDDDNNAVALAWLLQVNFIRHVDDELIDGYSGDINVTDSIRDFSGIANANLNTGAMNNQAIQQTIAVSVNSGSSQIGN